MKVKMKNLMKDIWFNNECLRNNITPTYAKVKIKNKSKIALKVKQQSEILWIKYSLQDQHGKVDRLNKDSYKLHLELANTCNTEQFDGLYNIIIDNTEEMTSKKTKTIIKKMNQLRNKYNILNQNNHSTECNEEIRFADKLKNLSNVSFTVEEETLLRKGLKFTVEDKKDKYLENILVDSEVILESTVMDQEEKNNMRSMISVKVEDIKNKKIFKCKNNSNNKVVNRLKRKIDENDLILTKADKGYTTIVMKKEEYNCKIEEFISENNYKELNKDPTEIYQKEIKNKLKESKMYEKKDHYRITQQNPKAPYMKGFPKLHKVNNPIRPVIPFYNSPSYNLSKDLAIKLEENYNFEENRSIKNNLELIDNITNIQMKNEYRIASLDIVNMYGNIPKSELVDVLIKNNFKEYEHKEELISLVKLCLNQNYFQFNNQFYSQTDGLPMGSPLSPILANIYMNHFENKILQESKFKNNIISWFRYVDDILIIWSSSNRQMENFKNDLNKINDNIQFTLEIGGKELNYLDLNINIENNNLKTKIYRKPTYADAIIPVDSFHPWKYKTSAIENFIYRAIKCTTDDEDLKQEIQTIRTIARNNGYKPEIVNQIHNKVMKNITRLEDERKEKQKYTGSIEYIGKDTKKIIKIFKQHNINVTTKSAKSVFNKIKNNPTNNQDITKNSGVYQISCKECNTSYIGETGRQFKTRFKEHHADYIHERRKSLYAEHFIQTEHTYNTPSENFKILRNVNKYRKRKVLEELEISKARKNNIELMNGMNEFKSGRMFQFCK
uniref:Nicotine oxidoreductase n=1 Tax=Cacopsylla melanoneura TaxID=428564 RepID=A0A8D9BBF2_9HEMI